MNRLKRFLGIVALVVATAAAQCEGETDCPFELKQAERECEAADGTFVADWDPERGVWIIRCDGV